MRSCFYPGQPLTCMELFFKEFGQGQPVLIFHGLFGFSDNWQTIAKSLADEHMVYSIDLRNHGRSPHTATHSYPEMAEDIRSFMEQNWMFSSQVIGHSMGGKAAMQLALNYPDLVDQLIVVDIAPAKAEDKHTYIYKSMLGLDFDALEDRKQIDEQLAQAIDEPGVRQFLLKNITRSKEGKFRWKMNLPVLWEDYGKILDAVSSPHASVFEKPTLFIRGAKSDYITDEGFEQAKTLFPNARLETIDGAGHWVHADQPARLLEIVRDFLNS